MDQFIDLCVYLIKTVHQHLMGKNKVKLKDCPVCNQVILKSN